MDVVDRLINRNMLAVSLGKKPDDALDEAADEIKSLRAEVEELGKIARLYDSESGRCEYLEQWIKVAKWIHDTVDLFDGDCDDMRKAWNDISTVINWAFGDLDSAMDVIDALRGEGEK